MFKFFFRIQLCLCVRHHRQQTFKSILTRFDIILEFFNTKYSEIANVWIANSFNFYFLNLDQIFFILHVLLLIRRTLFLKEQNFVSFWCNNSKHFHKTASTAKKNNLPCLTTFIIHEQPSYNMSSTSKSIKQKRHEHFFRCDCLSAIWASYNESKFFSSSRSSHYFLHFNASY